MVNESEAETRTNKTYLIIPPSHPPSLPDAPIKAMMFPDRTDPVTPSKIVFFTVTLFPFAPRRLSVAYRFKDQPK